jgi:hypothetical protein
MRRAILSSIPPDLKRAQVDRRRGSLVIVLSASAVIGLSLVLSRPPLPFPRCLFRMVTGLPCPSCGLTRAFIALGHGRLAEACLQNIMSPVLLVALVAVLGVSAYETLADRSFLGPIWERVKNKVLVLVLVLSAFSWVWNLYKHFAHFAG